jgi:hypothetical protein
LKGRSGVKANENEPALSAQFAEEIQHEADVAILGIELGLIEQMHERVSAVRPLQHE